EVAKATDAAGHRRTDREHAGEVGADDDVVERGHRGRERWGEGAARAKGVVAETPAGLHGLWGAASPAGPEGWDGVERGRSGGQLRPSPRRPKCGDVHPVQPARAGSHEPRDDARGIARV